MLREKEDKKKEKEKATEKTKKEKKEENIALTPACSILGKGGKKEDRKEKKDKKEKGKKDKKEEKEEKTEKRMQKDLQGDYGPTAFVLQPTESLAKACAVFKEEIGRELERASYGPSGKKVLWFEFFCGSKRVALRMQRNHGKNSLGIDTLQGAHHDLTNPGVFAVIEECCEDGFSAGCHLGTPCGSWNAARHGTPGSGCPPPLRDRKENIYGFKEGLSQLDMARIKEGNTTMRVTGRLIKLFKKHALPTTLENGINSMLWFAPEIQEEMDKDCMQLTVDYCLMGMRWRKRTRLAGWNLDKEVRARAWKNRKGLRCSSKKGCCDRTGKPHVRLTGWARGMALTKKAEEYPRKFANLICNLLCGKA